jgi:hypothetical protein
MHAEKKLGAHWIALTALLGALGMLSSRSLLDARNSEAQLTPRSQPYAYQQGATNASLAIETAAPELFQLAVSATATQKRNCAHKSTSLILCQVDTNFRRGMPRCWPSTAVPTSRQTQVQPTVTSNHTVTPKLPIYEVVRRFHRDVHVQNVIGTSHQNPPVISIPTKGKFLRQIKTRGDLSEQGFARSKPS